MKLMNLVKFAAIAFILAIPAILASSLSSAAADAHGAGGIPTAFVLQIVNFCIYLGLLVYFLRQPIKDMFKNRYDGFFSALRKAEAARAEAEGKRKEIQDRLAKLEANRDQSIRDARAEAMALKNQIVEEAKALSAKLKTDAERTAQVEIERAKLALREELLSQSVLMAKRILTDKMQDQDQKRLQAEFVDKIQVVSQ